MSISDVDNYFPFDTGVGASATVGRWRSMARFFYGTGVIPGVGSQLSTSIAGSQVTTLPGAAYIDGFYGEILNNKQINIAPSTSGLVVARMDPGARKISIAFNPGAGTGQNPNQSLTGTYEIPLLRVVNSVGTDARIFSTGDLTRIGTGFITNKDGPAASVDVLDPNTSLFTMNVPVVNGRKYAITAYGQGTQVTAAGAPVQIWIADDQARMPAMSCCYSSSWPVNYIILGSTRTLFIANATRTAVITMWSRSGGAGALRIGANICHMWAEDLGTG